MEFAMVATQEPTVSTSSPLDNKELVRQAIDIVDLVGSHVQLRRQGRIYVGLCPWHDDTKPSMQVNPERQSFKCWVCDIGGDVFSFVMQMEGVEFREALSMLADRAGITLQSHRGHSHASGAVEGPQQGGLPAAVAGEQKRTLYRAMAWVEDQYHKCLLEDPQGEPARKYLDERGITAESIEQFHLGFSPNQHDWMLGQVGSEPSRTKILESVGVLARSQQGGSQQGGGLYDRFRGRLLFSIRDAQGKPVGIGGRVLPESGATSPAKYVNSPETPLFSKSKLLYGLDVARDAMRKSRTALVMEGYTDVIVAHQYGFTNAVAVLGTALGENHVRILKRFVDRIILVLDGDEAGQRRANEVLELFVSQQADLQILTLPEGNDPCDFLHDHGADAFTKLIEDRAVDALDHAYRTETQGLDFENDVNGVDRALERLLSVIARAPRLSATTGAQHRNREWKLLSKLAMQFRIPEDSIRRRLTELRRRLSQQRRAPRPDVTPANVRPPEVGPPEMGSPEMGSPEMGSPEMGSPDMGPAEMGLDVTAAQPQPIEPQTIEPQTIEPAQRELLEVLVANPQCVASVRDRIDPRRMGPPVCRRIYETLCRLDTAGVLPDFDRLMLELDDAAVKNLLVELDESWTSKGEREIAPEALVEDLVRTFTQQEEEKQRLAQMAALRTGKLDDNQETQLLEEFFRQARSRQGISEPKDG